MAPQIPSLFLHAVAITIAFKVLSTKSEATSASSSALHCSRPFWYDVDVADDELREVLSHQRPRELLPDWLPAFESRSLSTASTSAGPSPVLEESSSLPGAHSPPPSPECSILPSVDGDASYMSPASTVPPGVPDTATWQQVRKVFVGGIPQSIDQNDLYKLFSKFGKVKKAWLQIFHTDYRNQALSTSRCHPGDCGDQASTARKHRGFGFVIFFEKQSVDKLLGEEFSQFICFSEGLRLEVKRAIGKAGSFGTPDLSSKAKSRVDPGLHEARSPSSSNRLQATPSMTVLSPWQNYPSAAVNNCGPLPSVPPFPSSWEPTELQWARETSPLAAVDTDPALQFLTYDLLNGFQGERPRNCQELASVLRDAMPDRYDD